MTNSLPQSDLLENDNLDIKRYLSIFFSNWYWFAISLFISLTIAYCINRYSPKVFSVSASLLIKDDQAGGMSSIASSVIPGGDIFRGQQNLKNEIEILKSYELNYKVMRELKDFHVVYMGVGRRGIVESMMYKDECPFKVTYDSLELQPKGLKVGISILDEQRVNIKFNGERNFVKEINFGETFNEFGFNFTIEKRDSGRTVLSRSGSNTYFFYFKDPRALASQFRAKLSVAPRDKDGSVVILTTTGFVAQQEVDYLNSLMAVYIDNGLELKKKIADSTISFINKQLETISDSLRVAEESLENYRKSNSFINIEEENALVQTRLQEALTEKAKYDLELQYYNYLSEYINNRNTNGAVISPSVIGITDQVLLRLVNDLSSLKEEKEKLRFSLEEDQPAVELLDKQIVMTGGALKESILNCIASLNQSKAATEKKIASFENEFNKLPSIERTFVNIQRQFDLNNTIFTYLLEKRAEAGIAQASTLPDNRTIDFAQLRGQVKPNKRTNMLIALVLGILFPGSGIILLIFFYNKVIDKKDIESKTRVPVIGYISHSDSKNEIAVVEKPGSTLAESFRSVRTAIKYFVRENEVTVIAVSSTVSSEGKTFISLNIAAILAMLGKKVLLIGLDLRKPRINKIFEHNDSLGMSTYLSGNCQYEDIIKKTHIDNLFYAPSGPVPPNPAELIERDLMETFMVKAKGEFDFIIFDTPPIAIVTDSLLLGKYSDINLFIVRQRYSSCNTLDLIEDLRIKGELKNMAIIINDINLSGYYGYGMRYGYLQGYGYSYGHSYYSSNYYGKYGKNDNGKGYYTES